MLKKTTPLKYEKQNGGGGRVSAEGAQALGLAEQPPGHRGERHFGSQSGHLRLSPSVSLSRGAHIWGPRAGLGCSWHLLRPQSSVRPLTREAVNWAAAVRGARVTVYLQPRVREESELSSGHSVAPDLLWAVSALGISASSKPSHKGGRCKRCA